VSWVIESFIDSGAVVCEVVEDLVGGFGPAKGFRVLVPGFDPGGDGVFESLDTAVGGAAQLAVGQFGEPVELPRFRRQVGACGYAAA
jgi:hypothetical protein